MDNIAIKVDGLSKQYRIGARQERYKTLRESIAQAFAAPVRRLTSIVRDQRNDSTGASRGTPGSDSHIWALRDVSLEIKRGAVVGIIGRNGAGKSTLLKILSRITEPTEGYADIHGRVGSLLEVGTGFHPELTGRENIYLNGAVLGMRHADIQRKFDEIVAFAEVEKFIDTPVKHYSSGMYLRLAFAVAAHLEPEILLVDEVLAVGDVAFQKKCMGKMGDVSREGRTVLLVSHNMGAIASLCEQVVWLDGGRVCAIGDANSTISNYLSKFSQGALQVKSNAAIDVTHVALRRASGEETTTFNPGDPITIEIRFFARKRIVKPYMWISVSGQTGPLFAANMFIDGQRPEALEGEAVITCAFKSVPLLPQSYTISMAMRDHTRSNCLFEPQELTMFHVVGKLADYGMAGERADIMGQNSIPLVIPYEWRFPDGSIRPVKIDSAGGNHDA